VTRAAEIRPVTASKQKGPHATRSSREGGGPEPTARRLPKRTRTEWIRFVGYWIATLLVAQENVAGSLWLWLKLEYVRANLVHLGYPPYFERIIGFLAAPRCGRPTRPRLWDA